MEKLLLLAFGIAVLALGLKLASKAKAGTAAWPVKATQVLTRPEQVLYWRLLEALPDVVVLAQVQLSRIMKIDAAHNRRTWLNRIDRKSADFVLCSKDLQPRFVIELDDASHTAASRQKADADKAAALQAAGILVVRFNVKSMPSVEQIKAAVAAGTQSGT